MPPKKVTLATPATPAEANVGPDGKPLPLAMRKVAALHCIGAEASLKYSIGMNLRILVRPDGGWRAEHAVQSLNAVVKYLGRSGVDHIVVSLNGVKSTNKHQGDLTDKATVEKLLGLIREVNARPGDEPLHRGDYIVEKQSEFVVFQFEDTKEGPMLKDLNLASSCILRIAGGLIDDALSRKIKLRAELRVINEPPAAREDPHIDALRMDVYRLWLTIPLPERDVLMRKITGNYMYPELTVADEIREQVKLGHAPPALLDTIKKRTGAKPDANAKAAAKAAERAAEDTETVASNAAVYARAAAFLELMGAEVPPDGKYDPQPVTPTIWDGPVDDEDDSDDEDEDEDEYGPDAVFVGDYPSDKTRITEECAFDYKRWNASWAQVEQCVLMHAKTRAEYEKIYPIEDDDDLVDLM